jgi:phosphoglycerol transferase MdoB-like AlkP superfamily enzyme
MGNLNVFFYLYADILTFYQTGALEEIIGGELAGVQINQAFSLTAAIVMAIPSVMVFLSLALKAKVNRWANIIVGIYSAGLLLVTVLLAAAFDPHYILYDIIEAVLIALIIGYAWKWPKQEG